MTLTACSNDIADNGDVDIGIRMRFPAETIGKENEELG